MGPTNTHLKLARAALENGAVPVHERVALLEIIDGVQNLCRVVEDISSNVTRRFDSVDEKLTAILNSVGGKTE